MHPEILRGAATEQERQALKRFLCGLAGVNAMDTKAVSDLRAEVEERGEEALAKPRV